MRVSVSQRKQSPHHKTKSKRPLALLIVAGLIVGGVIFGSVILLGKKPNNAMQPISDVVAQNIQVKPKNGQLKQFSGTDFQKLYDNFTYPNTSLINENTAITGDPTADAHIRKLAVERGYRLRSAPVANAFKSVGQNFMLQEKAAQPWLDLQSAAKKDGVNLGLTAAYRSADEQREIFMQRLSQQAISVSGIASGAYDAQVLQVLKMTAVPGYSRHHNGYTIDIACEDMPATSFKYTNCFEWLSENNYLHTKTYGWIPSYPEEANNQGPDPESWEYAWVGVETLKN